MLDLKAKLAAAGLVSAADVAAAERQAKPRPQGHARDNHPRDNHPRDNHGPRPTGPKGHDPKASPNRAPNQPPNRASNRAPERAANRTTSQAPNKARPILDVAALQRPNSKGEVNKGEAYDAIRRAVEAHRLDPAHGIPGEHATPFHFSTATGQLSRLTLEPQAHTALTEGQAGLIAFMSHHGLAHCVVPRPLAEAVHELFPLWLRVLKDHPGAGQTAPRPTTSTTPNIEAGPPSGPREPSEPSSEPSPPSSEPGPPGDRS